MRILITGICGFVGSELAISLRERLFESDCQILGIDNLSRNGSWRNRERLPSLGIDVHHGDIRCSSDMEPIGPVDWVIDALQASGAALSRTDEDGDVVVPLG